MQDLKLLQRAFPGASNQTKRVILNNAVTCFNLYGVETTSMDTIRRSANVSVGSLYYHFKSKEAVIASIVLAALEDVFQYRRKYLLNAENFEECTYALVISYLEWVEENPQVARIMLSKEFIVNSGEFKKVLEDTKNNNRKRIIHWLSLPENKITNCFLLPSSLYFSFVNGIPEHFCRAWLLGKVLNSPKSYRKALAVAVWGGVSGIMINRPFA